MSGLFITVEGTDGAGKTTQIQLLADYLKAKGFEVFCTREPGGNKISEAIRNVIIDVNNSEMTDVTEALLYAAARAQHVTSDILPVLNNGGVVISDRFLDSSLVYQGYARGMGEKFIQSINKCAVAGLEPDITFFLKLSPKEGIVRKRNQAKLDRIEAESFNFHKRVYEGYINLARRNKHRIKTVNAMNTIEGIHEEIVAHIEQLLSEKSI